MQQARHWSAPEIFGSRAKFNADTDPATLDIEVESRQNSQLIPLNYLCPLGIAGHPEARRGRLQMSR